MGEGRATIRNKEEGFLLSGSWLQVALIWYSIPTRAPPVGIRLCN